GTMWSIRVTGTHDLTQLDVQDSDARSGTLLVATLSVDSGNNRNWDFGIATLRTWWGTVNTNWSNGANWDTSVPGAADSAIIVSTATRMPTLTTAVIISSLTVVPTSSITLNGF